MSLFLLVLDLLTFLAFLFVTTSCEGFSIPAVVLENWSVIEVSQ
jgi:hypothetical protein